MSARIYGRLGRGVGFSSPIHVPWVVIAILMASFCPTRHAHGQVPSTITLARGEAATICRNPMTETLAVTVELRARMIVNGAVVLGHRIDALVSPGSFALAPGAEQVVRIRVKEAVPVGTVLAGVFTFTPVAAPEPSRPETAAVARLTLVTRMVIKVVAR